MDKLKIFHTYYPPLHTEVTETKLKTNNSVSLNMLGYRFIYKNSHANSGRVGIYVKQGIFFLLKMIINNPLVEDIWIDAKLNGSNSSTVVTVIYFHPHLSHQTFQDELESQLENLDLSSKKVFIIDFNINLFQKSQSVVNYLRSLTTLGFVSLIDCPTHFMLNLTPSLLDHIYTNQHKKIHCGTIAFPISDHHPTYALL